VHQARSWQQAWEDASATFYRAHYPCDHFRTDAMTGASAARILPLLHRALASTPGPLTIVDVGAGDGSLALGLMQALDGTAHERRVRAICIDVRESPAHLDSRIEWICGDARSIPLQPFDGLLVAHEFLDDLPCPWIECDADGIRHAVIVDAAGRTHLGPPVADHAGCAHLGIDGPAIDAWLDRWWPTHRPFARCEPGSTRDAAWALLTSKVRNGYAIAIDYGHLLPERAAGTWDGGTITGYQRGRVVTPVPDGSCNITAHVSMDAVARAARTARSTSLERLHGDFWYLVQSFGPATTATMPQ